MDNWERNFYDERDKTDAHSLLIPTAKSDIDTAYASLLRNVFQHQYAVFDEVTVPLGTPSKDQIAHEFYVHHYLPVDLRWGRGGNRTVTPEEFMEQVVFSRTDRIRNRLFYLLGGVGSGKTSFINYLITLHGRRWISDGDVCFVRVDILLRGRSQRLTYDGMLRAVVSKLRDVFQRNEKILGLTSYRELKALDKYDALSDGQLETAICDFVQAYHRQSGRQLLLIIDNLDYLYHSCDRESFFPSANQEFRETATAITKLVSSFDNDAGPLGKLGANILFSLRTESYEILQTTKELLPDSLRFDDTAYEIQPPDWTALLAQRCSLLEWAVEQLKDGAQRRSFNRVVEQLLQSSTEGRGLLVHLKAMCNYGLRDLMGFFAQYSWVETRANKLHTPEAGLSRFTDHPAVGLITFMLKAQRRYSQSVTSFPNVYLVNVQEADDSLGFPRQHPHTYWLKWLILNYILRHQRQKLSVSPTALIECFAYDDSGKTQGQKCYMEDLVRACLGSMSEASGSNLIAVKREVSREKSELVIGALRLTDRGRHCVENIFDRLFYLQLMVDDYMLPIPKCIRSEFDYSNDAADYSFLVEPDQQYYELSHKVVATKARQVMLLLEVLDVAALCEEARYETVFRRLKSQGVALPDVGTMRRRVMSEMAALQNRGYRLSPPRLQSEAAEARKALEDSLTAAYSRGGA